MYIIVFILLVLLATVFTILAVMLKHPDRPDRIVELVLFGGLAVGLWWAAGIGSVIIEEPYHFEYASDTLTLDNWLGVEVATYENVISTDATTGTHEHVEGGVTWVFFALGIAVCVYIIYAIFNWPEKKIRSMP